MVTRPVLQQPVIDAVDIRSVAEFYRELLGLHYRAGDELADGREPDSADWLVLLDDDGRRVLTFQRTDELKPSTWPYRWLRGECEKRDRPDLRIRHRKIQARLKSASWSRRRSAGLRR